MVCKSILMFGAALFIAANCRVAIAQHHHDDHGGHFDWHNGHLDWHVPGHWDIHGGHLDWHQGHVDHLYPNYIYPSNPAIYDNWYYPGATVYPGATIVNPPVVTNPLPGNPASPNSVTTGYAPNNAPITIANPDGYSTPLSFTLNGQTVRLEPGKATTITFDRNYVIKFDRGGNFGTAEYSLRDGTFEFVVGENGWDLKRVRAEAETNPLPPAGLVPPTNPLPGG